MRLLLVAELLLAPFLVESRVLTGVGRTAAAGGVGLLGLLVSLAAYPAFVPWLGPTGGAVGSMLAYAVMTLLAHRAVRADRGPAWGAATPVVARAARPCPPRRSAARPGPCPPREPQ
jgi:Na+-driven multidrug efflux pump